MNLRNFLISGRFQLFLQLWNASPNTSIQRVSQITVQTKQCHGTSMARKATWNLQFFGSSLKNRINHACPLQKGVTHICQWPLDPLGLRSTSKDHRSFSKVHALSGVAQLWKVSDSANKTFLKRTNTDKILSIIKGLLFSMVDVSSSGWRYNSTVLR